MFAVVCGEQMSAKNRWSSSQTRVDPLGERFGDPSGQTVAWNASFCSSISRFMSSVRMPISCPLPVSISAHGIASRPRWFDPPGAGRGAAPTDTKGDDMVTYTVPGLKTDSAERVVKLLQDRLNSLNDLALTLNHVHWNVTGPNFIAVHTMLDPQVDAVRAMVDETAERIAALGGAPVGPPRAPGATTPSAGPARSSILARWTSSTPGSSRRTAARSTAPRNSTWSPRTCSSARPASWKNSTGSSP